MEEALGEAEETEATLTATHQVQLDDLDETYKTNCPRCCTVTIGSNYFPYKKIVEDDEREREFAQASRFSP